MDPATLALLLKGAGKVLGKIGPAVGSALGARAGAEALKQDPEQIAQQYADLKSNMPQYGVGSAFNEYLAMSKQDPAADMQRQIAAEQEASNIDTLKTGGAKALLGGLGASQRQAAQSRMGIEADSAKRQMSALQTYGAQQQRAQDMNTRMQQQLASSQFQAERGAEQYNRQLEAQRKLATGQALGALAGQFGKGHFKDLNFGVKDAPVNYNTESIDSLVSQGLASYATPDAGYGTVTDFGDEYVDPITSIMGNFQFNEDGGMITKGAFSHEANPIDIMQDGAKVGEMTGGEAILNPEQQNKVAKQSPYFRKLMREFAMRDRR